MKQYRKGREPLFPLFECDRKNHCGFISYCGDCGGDCRCHLTTHKRWAKKDDRGKPIKSGMWVGQDAMGHG